MTQKIKPIFHPLFVVYHMKQHVRCKVLQYYFKAKSWTFKYVKKKSKNIKTENTVIRLKWINALSYNKLIWMAIRGWLFSEERWLSTQPMDFLMSIWPSRSRVNDILQPILNKCAKKGNKRSHKTCLSSLTCTRMPL